MPWTRDVLRLPACKEQLGPEGEVVFRGPRVRMGVHFAAEGTVVHRCGWAHRQHLCQYQRL